MPKKNLQQIIKSVKQAKKDLQKFSQELPDLDAYCMVNSITMYAIEDLDKFLNSLPAAAKNAKKLAKKHPNLKGKNR